MTNLEKMKQAGVLALVREMVLAIGINQRQLEELKNWLNSEVKE